MVENNENGRNTNLEKIKKDQKKAKLARERAAAYYKKNKEKIKERERARYLKDHDKILARRKEQYEKIHKEKKAEYYKKVTKVIYENNEELRQKKRNAAKAYHERMLRVEGYREYKSAMDAKKYIKWKNIINERQRKYHNIKYKTDEQFKIKTNIRSMINYAIREGHASNSLKYIIGVSYKEFKEYIESKFQPGMSWTNRKEWHIDHIKPIANFDLTNLAELKQCYHYTNMVPLWKKDNLRKAKSG